VREKIISELEAGEVGVMFASTDVGKTTLSLNLSLMLAAGGAFEPLVERKEGSRRVLYIDGETRQARLQADVRQMLHGWGDDEKTLVEQNLHLACDATLDGNQLDLTKHNHLKWLKKEAERVKPDLIILDTMVSLFSLNNENDNSEVARQVMKPLAKLASDTGAAILLLHHIGKLSEDSQASTKAYRGRGASAICKVLDELRGSYGGLPRYRPAPRRSCSWLFSAYGG
jgi:RecA-family ATPase